jgi:hypothetical protein
MADSSFWRNLAEKFSGIALILAALRADYYYTLGSGCAEWKLRGAQGGSVIHFETLARRGASALPGADGSELLQAWLEALKSVSSTFRLELSGIEQNADGSEGAHHYTGTIVRVCEASADYCREMEGRALEAEVREKQRIAAGADDTNSSEITPVVAESAGRQIRRHPEVGQTKDEDRFPDRAAWLKERLRERSWNKHDVSRQGGPDRKTVQKILDGRHVREDVLEKLAKALSNAPVWKKLPAVNPLDIPAI